jgi:hypothetical protein
MSQLQRMAAKAEEERAARRAAEEAARAAAAGKRAAAEAAQRARQKAKSSFFKRTRSGQPVMAVRVDKILAALTAGAAKKP